MHKVRRENRPGTKPQRLEGNADLIDTAIAELAGRKAHPMANITRIDTRIDVPGGPGSDRHWFDSRSATCGHVEFDLETIPGPGVRGRIELEVSGCDGPTLVARRREVLDLG